MAANCQKSDGVPCLKHMSYRLVLIRRKTSCNLGKGYSNYSCRNYNNMKTDRNVSPMLCTRSDWNISEMRRYLPVQHFCVNREFLVLQNSSYNFYALIKQRDLSTNVARVYGSVIHVSGICRWDFHLLFRLLSWPGRYVLSTDISRQYT